MKFEDTLVDIDYLVYSSHKTGTQTLVRTMNGNGFLCRHCHSLPNIGLKGGDFKGYLESYLEKNKRKLNVITVFREPMERHISSFFQVYGSRPLRMKEAKNKVDTIIFRSPVKKLQEKFIFELNAKSLIGMRESIHHICNDLLINVDVLPYNMKRQFGLYETEHIKLYIFRFDVLFDNFETLLGLITNKNIEKIDANISTLKWYKDIYIEFKASLVVPFNIILEVYDLKRDIIKLLNAGNYKAVLNRALAKYGRPRKITGSDEFS
jgi:hypothetical protein